MRGLFKSHAPLLCTYMGLTVKARKLDYSRHYENKLWDDMTFSVF